MIKRQNVPNARPLGSRKTAKPLSHIEYLPITPRLRATAANQDMAKRMEYRKNYEPSPNMVRDVFDGTHYRELLTKPVIIANQTLPFYHFPTIVVLPLGSPQMVLVVSNIEARQHGHSFSLTTLCHQKNASRRIIRYRSALFLDPTNQRRWIHLLGRLSRK